MLATPFDVVGLGRTSIDFLGIMDGFIQPDTKVKLDEFSVQGGGPAATAMVTVRRLGLSAAFIGKTGDDFFGQFMRAALAQENVDTSGLVQAPGLLSQYASIAIDRNTGARTILWTDGTVPAMAPSEVNWPLLTGIKALHVDGHHLPAALAAAHRARAQNTLISYDAGTLRPGTEQLAELADILAVTPQFARDFTGERDLQRMLLGLRRGRAAWTVITLGADGSIGYDGVDVTRAPAFPVNVIDTTGAGDVFHGALLVAALRQWPLNQALRFANAVAAMKCRKLGGRPGIPNYQQALEFAGLHNPAG